jgi:hypothetical protein
MTCMAPGCKNVQCYVCSKSCTGYEHFNDPNRGGVMGNCPLFDDQDKRHEDEVRIAEEKARQQAREENSDLDEKTWEKVAGPLQAGADRLQQALEAIVAHAPPRPPPANRNPAPLPPFLPAQQQPPNQNPGRAIPGPAVPAHDVRQAPRPAHPVRPGPPVRPGLPPVANPGGAPPENALPSFADQLFGQAGGVLGEPNPFYNPWLAEPRQNPAQEGPVRPLGFPPPGFLPYGDQRAFLGIQDIQNANSMAALADRQAALEQMVNRLQQQPRLEAYAPVLRPSQLPPPAPRARAPPLNFPPFLMGLGSRPRPDNIGLRSIQGGAQGGAGIPALAAPVNLRNLMAEDQGLVPGAPNRNPGAAGRAA